MPEQLQSLSFAAIANAFITHPKVDSGDDVGWLDFDNGIPSDFSGALLCNKQPTHLYFNYHVLEEGYEIVEIEQEIELPSAVILLNFSNGSEQIGFNGTESTGTISASFDGTRLHKFVVDVDGNSFTFERDLSHQNGIAPIFIEV